VPAVLQLSTPVTAPANAGPGIVTGEPIGHVDELRSWQNGGFQPGGRTFTLNCLAGSVLGTAASASGVAIAFRCPDGAVAAVAVTPATQIAPNLLIGGLQPGDDLSVALLSADPPACQATCVVLPIAAQVGSQAAATRQAQPLAPRQQPGAAATAPPAVAPARAGATSTTAPQPRPAAAAPVQTVPAAPVAPAAPPAPTAVSASGSAPSATQPAANPTVNTTVVAPARPIPTQPAYVPPRPIPTQPR
jgi:hypothetical protein